MTAWSNWESLSPAAPWIGAALLLLVGLAATALVWARWKPVPGDEESGMPLLLRYGPALALGSGCATLIWLAASEWELQIRAGASIAALLAVTVICAAWLGRVGDRAVRLMVERAFWKLNAEGVANHLRREFRKDEMLGYAAMNIMTELEATSVLLFLLENDHFELVTSLPSPSPKPASFAQNCVLAQAFGPAGRVPFLEILKPSGRRPGDWSKNLKDVSAAGLQAEQRILESLEAEGAWDSGANRSWLGSS